jgi:flagellar protein FliO/FliZ
MRAPNLLCTSALALSPMLGLAAEPLGYSQTPLGGNLTQMFLGLGLILALIAGAAWLLRRFTPFQGAQGAIKVLGGLTLGTRERLVLVQVGEVQLLLGITPGGMQTLYVLNETEAREGFVKTLDLAQEETRNA